MDVVLGLSVPVTIVLWGRWYYSLRLGRSLGLSQRGRWAFALVPLFCGLFLFAVLRSWSAASVRSDFTTLVLYVLLGASWVALAQLSFGLLGVSARDDVLERRNPAAAWVISGQLIAATFCFVGANVGNGPGPEVVLFCAALSIVALILLWSLVDSIAAMADTITIDRNTGAGIRTCGWLIATGIVLGAAVTGNWRSTASTLRAFAACAWPAAALALLVALFERRMRSLAADNRWSSVRSSIAVAALFVLGAAAYSWKRGIR